MMSCGTGLPQILLVVQRWAAGRLETYSCGIAGDVKKQVSNRRYSTSALCNTKFELLGENFGSRAVKVCGVPCF